jgi:hypothetical protein
VLIRLAGYYGYSDTRAFVTKNLLTLYSHVDYIVEYINHVTMRLVLHQLATKPIKLPSCTRNLIGKIELLLLAPTKAKRVSVTSVSTWKASGMDHFICAISIDSITPCFLVSLLVAAEIEASAAVPLPPFDSG